MKKNRKMTLLAIFCIVVLLNAMILIPGNFSGEKSKVAKNEIISGKKLDKWWGDWYINCNNSSKLKNETKEFKYYQFGQETNENKTIIEKEIWPSAWNKDQNSNGIDDSIETKNQNESVDILICYNQTPKEKDVEQLKSEFKINITNVFNIIPTIAAKNVSVSIISSLKKLSNVVRIEEQEKIQSYLDVSTRAIKARYSTVYPPGVWGSSSSLGYQGSGINIAIIDTGVNDNDADNNDGDLNDGHPSLAGKFIAGVDYAPSGSGKATDGSWNPHDTAGHGTHCAGTAMGVGGPSGDTYSDNKGVAPEAMLIDVKVMNALGSGSNADIIDGVEWCVSNIYTAWSDYTWSNAYGIPALDGIDVISMSIGSSSGSDGTDALSAACNAAVDAGLVVVAAMGNAGTQLVPAPAAADKVIAVSASDDIDTISRANDIIASYSNSGPRDPDGDNDQYDELKPDVTAPGTDIIAPRATGTTLGDEKTQYYTEASGTSMACPHIAGVVALMREAYYLCPAQIKSMLRKTAEQKGSLYDSSKSDKYNVNWGFGYVDAYGAVSAAKAVKDFIESRQNGNSQYIDPDDYDINTKTSELQGNGYGFIKLYNPSGQLVTDGPDVYPSDCPQSTMPSHSTHSYSGNDHSDEWGGNEVNAEYTPAKGNIVGSTNRIGKDFAEGIGMAEPILYGPSSELYSPLLLTIENFESSIILQNPTDDYVDATVKFYYFDGTLVATEYVTDIPSHGSITLNANNYLLSQSGNAEVIVTNGEGLVGFTKTINMITRSGMSEPLLKNIETKLYHHPLGTCLYSPSEYFILQNPTSSTVYLTIDFYTTAGTYDGTLNIQRTSHSSVQIQDLNCNAEITVTNGLGVVGISIGEDTTTGMMMSAPLISNPKEVLISPYLEEIGSWDSHIIIHNPSNTLSDIEINFYNLDGTLACSDNIYDMAAHSTIILNGDDYKVYWDEPHANVFITVTDGSNIIGCVSHIEPIYFIGMSTNLIAPPQT